MVQHTTSQGWDAGYGHDLSGWEFYKDVKVAYGSVTIDGTTYENPKPARMYWQPDKMICEYELGDVTVREEKFIAANDVVSTTITSSKPVTFTFRGRSFITQTAGRKMYTSTAEGSFDKDANVLRVDEGGTVDAQPEAGNIQERRVDV